MRAASLTFIMAISLLTPDPAFGRAGPPALADRPRTDSYGDPLPEGAIARFGTGRFRTTNSYFDAAVSLDGKLIALFGRSGMVLLEATTGKEVRPVKREEDHRYTTSVVFSPESRLMADIGFSDIEIRDLVKGKPVSKISIPGQQIRGSIVFSPDAKMLAVGCQEEQDKPFVAFWNVVDGKEIRRIAVRNTQHIHSVFSPNGKMLVTWGQPESRKKEDIEPFVLHFWDVDSGKTIRLVTLNHSAPQVVFSPDSKHFLVSEYNSSLTIRDVATGKTVRQFTGSSGVSEVAYSPDGKLLATASQYSGIVQIWDAGTGRRLSQCKGPPNTTVLKISFLAGNRLVATGGCRHMLRRWEVPSGRELTPSKGHLEPVETVAFSLDGKTVLSAGQDGMLVREIASGKELRRWSPPSDQNRFFAREGTPHPLISPTGKYLLWAGTKGGHARDISVVDCSSAEEVADFGIGQGLHSFGQDGMHVAVVQTEYADAKRPSVVNVWDLDRGSVTGKVKVAAATDYIYSIALSPDAKRLVAATVQDKVEQTILWDIKSRKELSRLPITSAHAMMFSRSGELLATNSKGALRVWSPADGCVLQSMEGIKVGDQSQMMFSPDDRLLAVIAERPGFPNHDIQLCELASGKVRASYTAHRGGTLALAFTPDGRLLASGGSDTTVVLWDVAGTKTLARSPRVKPTEAEQTTLWAELDSLDARKAHSAIARLSTWPEEAAALIARELKAAPGKPPEEKDVQRMIADLGNDSFKVREKATQALEKAGLVVRPALLKALPKASDLENKRRIEKLLEVLHPGPTQEMLRPTRALEVLERAATAKAHRLVETLAKGNPGARLTMEASKVLQRMKQKP